MTFQEFHSWATAHVLFEIGEGNSLRGTMHAILNQVAQNEVFGGSKPVPEGYKLVRVGAKRKAKKKKTRKGSHQLRK